MVKPLTGLSCRLLAVAILMIAFVTFQADLKIASAQASGDDNLMMDLQTGGAELFKKVSPSVIQIFNLDYQNWGGGSGSGYVIDKEGHAITNKHVVGNSLVVEVAFFGDENSEKRHKAYVVGEDPQLDLAIIKIETDPSLLHPIKLADSNDVKVGDVVATLGSPGGDAGIIDPSDRSFGSSNWLDFFNFNIGIVDEILDFRQATYFYSISSKDLLEQYGQYYASGVQTLFHVSAAINEGNSGGPCINAKGEVIGTNTWGWQSRGENVGYSVPVNLLKRSARDIIQYGGPKTPWLGIICHPTTIPDNWYLFEAQVGLTNKSQLWFNDSGDNLLIHDVNPYSPAWKAGIRPGDILLNIDGHKFSSVFDVYKYILNGRIGQKVTVMLRRNNLDLAPIIVELGEKKVRYDALKIDSVSIYGYSKPYQAGLTY